MTEEPTREPGATHLWEPADPTIKEATKADILVRLERAEQELSMGLQWQDNPGLQRSGLQEIRDIVWELTTLSFDAPHKTETLHRLNEDLDQLQESPLNLNAERQLQELSRQIVDLLDHW